MEIKSEPTKYETIQVTDIDIAFPGDLQTYTLREGVDSMRLEGDVLEITLGVVGRIQFHLQHAHWVAERKRSIRAVAPAAPPATPPE